ncbi:hypothetical protein [Bradyrhizobium genomosp. III]|uniref:hypothetical protein n=1 Tax=Bradyrhizobium genomosp. III TaxID=2683271 RepID=UPI0012F4987F|nr:hypothetical protein [Bradyrhizobium sp. CCBAU 15544]
MTEDLEIEKLIAELHALAATAQVYPFQPLLAKAKEHDCHRNVDLFVSQNAGHRTVRGWLIFDFRNLFLLGLQPIVRFTAHSLIENEQGQKIDITPSRASQPYPFIEHPFGETDFMSLVDGRQISHIDVEC